MTSGRSCFGPNCFRLSAQPFIREGRAGEQMFFLLAHVLPNAFEQSRDASRLDTAPSLVRKMTQIGLF